MLLTITCDGPGASDLGYLLHKHPDRLHERDLGFGISRVVFPEVMPDRCTAALCVEVDPIGLARGSSAGWTDGYVTDRPYVAGSLLSVALGRTFGSALAGRSRERPERVGEAMPLEATLSAVHCPAGEPVILRAFEPLGYQVECLWHSLDDRFPEWGNSVATVTLRGRTSVRDLLRHIYILAPVLDGSKHYFVGPDEVDKLLRHGEGWLAGHPDRDGIVRRYLRYKAGLARKALAALVAEDAERDVAAEAEEDSLEKPVRLNDQRLAAVLSAVRDPEAKVRSVADLGCGEGRLLATLAREAALDRILGLDVSVSALDRAESRLERERLPAHRRDRIRLVQGSLVYRDDRLRGFDALVLVEVIEHLEPGRLPALEHAVFRSAAPRRVVVTTPNVEYNGLWTTLPSGRFRHRDHRFEWTRAEFEAWADRVASESGYRVRFQAVGQLDAERGAPTQMAIFDREGNR